MTAARKAAQMLVLALALSGCASVHSRADDAIGGVLAGAAAGGAVGAVCCGDPVHGLPAGILIGGIAGGAAGLLWPTKQ